MVIKFRMAKNIEQSDHETYIVLYSINKVEIFDLCKKEIVAAFSIRNASYTSIMHKNFVANLAENNCVIDLQKMEIVKKFKAHEIIEKYLLEPKYRSKKFHIEEFGSGIIEITDEKLIYKARYSVSDFGVTKMNEVYFHICEFDVANWQLLQHYRIDNNYTHKIVKIKPPFLNDDAAILEKLKNNLLSNNGSKYDRILFFNTIYNVVCYRINDTYYIKYLDDLNFNKKEKCEAIHSNDFFSKYKEPGFDTQDYIRKHGLTREVFETFSEPEIIDGGYFWALDRIDALSKQEGQTFTKYLESHTIPNVENILYLIGLLESEIENDGFFNLITGGDIIEFDIMIGILNSIGAKKTAMTIENGKKIMIAFEGLKEKSLENYRDFEKESIKMEEELEEEDYVGLAVAYLRKSILVE